MSESVIQTQLSRVRGRHKSIALADGLLMALWALLAWLPAVMILDWLMGFPLWLRAVSLAAVLGMMAWFIAKRAVFPIIYPPDDESIALMVERDRPEFQTRLIASVQFSSPSAPPEARSHSLVRAMMAQTEDISRSLDFREVMKFDRVVRLALWFAGALLLALVLFWWGGSVSRALLERAMLMNTPLPTKTQLESITGNQTVPLGDPFKLSFKASGYRPADGEVNLIYANGRIQRLPLVREEDGVTFSVTLDSVQEPFAYSGRVYDGRSAEHRIQVVPRPAVTQIECMQIYPEYTGLAPSPRSTNDLQLVHGSRLRLNVIANKPLRTANPAENPANYAIRFADEKLGKSAKVALTVDLADRRKLSVDMPLPPETIAFSIHLTDEEGITSKDPAVYRVELIPDAPPRVRIVQPDRKEVLVTSRSTLDVGFIAEDDYGVASATLWYKIDDTSPVSVALSVPPREKIVRGNFPWSISRIPLPARKTVLEGSVIEFWIEIADGNTITGPGKVNSEKYMARVVTTAEKQAELMARLGESLGSIRDVSESQERANSELGTILREIPQTPPGK